MDRENTRARTAARWLVIAAAALLLQRVSPARATAPPPKDFPRSSLVAGRPFVGERSGAGVLVHAQWVDDAGEPQKWFKGTTSFPWPKPLDLDDGSFRLRLDGVRYPGDLQLAVFRRIGRSRSPMGAHTTYTCPATPMAAATCRWVPAVADGHQVWDVEVDHRQSRGDLYVVAVGAWDDPRDPPHPVGARTQIATWIYHARV